MSEILKELIERCEYVSKDEVAAALSSFFYQIHTMMESMND